MFSGLFLPQWDRTRRSCRPLTPLEASDQKQRPPLEATRAAKKEKKTEENAFLSLSSAQGEKKKRETHQARRQVVLQRVKVGVAVLGAPLRAQVEDRVDEAGQVGVVVAVFLWIGFLFFVLVGAAEARR